MKIAVMGSGGMGGYLGGRLAQAGRTEAASSRNIRRPHPGRKESRYPGVEALGMIRISDM